MAIDYSKVPSPCFVLEETLLRSNLKLIQEVQEAAGCSIILALKAFSMYSVFPIVGEYLGGATASSLNEIKLINDFLRVKAHTYIPAYLDEEFEEVLERSSHVTFNTLSQHARFKERVADYNTQHPNAESVRGDQGESPVFRGRGRHVQPLRTRFPPGRNPR